MTEEFLNGGNRRTCLKNQIDQETKIQTQEKKNSPTLTKGEFPKQRPPCLPNKADHLGGGGSRDTNTYYEQKLVTLTLAFGCAVGHAIQGARREPRKEKEKVCVCACVKTRAWGK